MSHLFCGRYAHSSIFASDTLSVCKNCDVRISEMVEFLSSDRVHMQQAMFPDVQQSYILHSQIAFDEVSCKVLVGVPLKQNEFLKVDQTCLGDVISEETGNEHLQPGSPLQGKGDGEGGEKLKKALEGEKPVADDSPPEEVSLPVYGIPCNHGTCIRTCCFNTAHTYLHFCINFSVFKCIQVCVCLQFNFAWRSDIFYEL